MSKKSEVIYRRPKGAYNDNDPTSWEDNAIIDAYNASVDISLTTEDTNSPSKIMEVNSEDFSDAYPIWQRRPDIEGTPYTNKTDPEVQWKVGDKCVAKYYEDELYYDATILSMDEKNNSCEVEFIGYGNKENVNMEDVHHESKWEAGDGLQQDFKRLSMSSSSNTDTSTTDLSDTQKKTASSDSTSTSTSFCSSSSAPKTKRKIKSRKNQFPYFPPPMMPGYYPNMPYPQPPNFNQFMPMPNVSNQFYNNSKSPLDNDELSNLMMSWYMAGYQTGYFQGKHKKS